MVIVVKRKISFLSRRKGQFYILGVVVLLISFGHLLASLGGNVIFDFSTVLGATHYMLNVKITKDIELLNQTCGQDELDIYVPWYMTLVEREYGKRGVIIRWYYDPNNRLLKYKIYAENYYLEKELVLK